MLILVVYHDFELLMVYSVAIILSSVYAHDRTELSTKLDYYCLTASAQ